MRPGGCLGSRPSTGQHLLEARLLRQQLALVAFSLALRGHRFLDRRVKEAQLRRPSQVPLDQRMEMALPLCSLAAVGQTPGQEALGLACHPGGLALPTGRDQAQQQHHHHSLPWLRPTREWHPHKVAPGRLLAAAADQCRLQPVPLLRRPRSRVALPTPRALPE